MKTATKPKAIKTVAEGHTPGPWKMLDVKDGRGNAVAFSVWPDLEQPYSNSPRGNQIVRTPDGLTPQAEANARLIAAAPDLLAACQSWDEGFTDGEQFTPEQFRVWVNERRKMARDAIAKAKGGSNV